ncbi:hypothetical protein LTR36_010445 [Oleoguttula mirabilis]|uniref:Uncharacterized protein n=1 Tax=Oleoguttula mirabilis TaxID=1507867 RepID=A0AAV9J5R9_9PEZI|nr:hypothetical protein LTR36_010445 [Oleoguttula mirabilis]
MLKRFHNDFTKAPKTLYNLSLDLQTLALLLREFERYRLETDDDSDALLLQCISRLQEEVEDIQMLVGRLEQRLDRSRTFGRLSTAFKAPEIQTCLNSLENAKSSMLLAHHLYLHGTMHTRRNSSYARSLTV